jgi:hypothetical protein
MKRAAGGFLAAPRCANDEAAAGRDLSESTTTARFRTGVSRRSERACTNGIVGAMGANDMNLDGYKLRVQRRADAALALMSE